MIGTPLARTKEPDGGSTVVEFVLVGPLVMVVALAVLHLCLAAYARSTFASAAVQGARAAALAGSDPAAAVERVRSVLDTGLAPGIVDDVSVFATALDDVPVIAVRIDGQIPGLSLLGGGPVTVVGHSVVEVTS